MMVNRLALTLAILGTLLFMTGFHSIDSAWNMRSLKISAGLELTDTSLIGQTITIDQAYMNGVGLIFTGFVMAVAGLIFIGHRKKKIMADDFE